MERTQHMIRSTAIVVFLFGISKLTGFGKLILMTEQFGLSSDADALQAAIQLPDLFMQMVSGGALGAAFIPVYSSYLGKESAEKQNALASTILTLVVVILVALCGVVAIFAPWVARVVLVPDFSAENQLLVAQLMRIVIFSMILVGASGVISAVLNTHQHFVLPALADVVIDVGQIIGILLLAPRYGIFGVAWGGVLGAVMRLTVQLPEIWRRSIRFRPKLALQLAGVREVLTLMGPRLVTIGGAQVSDIIIIRAASGLPEGSVSGFYYALLLTGIPVSLFGWAVGTVIFPTMSEQFNQGDSDGFRRTATNGLLALALLMFPAAAGLIALGRPAIRFIFERGAFDASSTSLMYAIVAILAVRIISDVGLIVCERIFYARHNTRSVMWFSLFWLVMYISAALTLIPRIGVLGLAIAHSVSFLISTLAMYLWLRREDGLFDERALAAGIVRILAACVVMGIPIYFLQQIELSSAAYVAVAIVAGGLTYAVAFGIFGRKLILEWLGMWRDMRAA